MTGIPVKVFGAMLILFAGAYVTDLYHKKNRLEDQVAIQQSIIEEQARHAIVMSDALETRDLELDQLQNTMTEIHNDWNEYRETIEDSCINNPHPNLHQWLPNQPNSYFDGDTPARIPATGI